MSLKVSDIIQQITKTKNHDWVRLMKDSDKEKFKELWWLVYQRLKMIKSPEVLLMLDELQIKLEQIKDNPELLFSVLVDKIPKGDYQFFYKKKVKKKDYDYDFLKILSKEYEESVSKVEEYYELYSELGILEDERKRLYQKYGIEYSPVKKNLGNVELVSISLLKEHPLNFNIYNRDRGIEDDELELSIKNVGVLNPIVVDKKSKQIISGHRRFLICKRLKMDFVPVIFNEFKDSELALIESNKHRVKTSSERIRESEILNEKIKQMSKEERIQFTGGITPRNFVARTLGVPKNTIYKEKFIKENDKMIFKKVDLGLIPLNTAYNIVKTNIGIDYTEGELQQKISTIKHKISELKDKVDKSKWLEILEELY